MIDELIDRLKPGDTELTVTAYEYAAVAKILAERVDLPPSAPVTESSESRGFFSYSRSEKRDYHAPEYLRALAAWEERHRQSIGPLCIYGPYGLVKLVIA